MEKELAVDYDDGDDDVLEPAVDDRDDAEDQEQAVANHGGHDACEPASEPHNAQDQAFEYNGG